jgi:hypothetical protein
VVNLTSAVGKITRLLAATIPLLDRRAFDVTVGAEYAAVAWQWSQEFVATFAVVVELASIRGHLFILNMATLRARQC